MSHGVRVREVVSSGGVRGALQYIRAFGLLEDDTSLFINPDLDRGRVRELINAFARTDSHLFDVLEDSNVHFVCRAVYQYYHEKTRRRPLLPAQVGQAMLSEITEKFSDEAIISTVNTHLRGCSSTGLMTNRQLDDLKALCSVLGDVRQRTATLAHYFGSCFIPVAMDPSNRMLYKRVSECRNHIVEVMMDQSGRCFRGCLGQGSSSSRNNNNHGSSSSSSSNSNRNQVRIPVPPPRTRVKVKWTIDLIDAKVQELRLRMQQARAKNDFEACVDFKSQITHLQQARQVQQNINNLNAERK